MKQFSWRTTMILRTYVLTALMFCALMLCLTTQACADSNVGMQFGEPGTVGLSLRFNNTAIGAAWNFLDNGYLHVNIDQWAMRQELEKPVDWFLGYGIDVGIGNDFRAAARVPVGLVWDATPKIEVFAQVAPGLKVLPVVDFYFGAAIGARYRF